MKRRQHNALLQTWLLPESGVGKPACRTAVAAEHAAAMNPLDQLADHLPSSSAGTCCSSRLARGRSTSSSNVQVGDMNIDVPVSDASRIEELANGMSLW